MRNDQQNDRGGVESRKYGGPDPGSESGTSRKQEEYPAYSEGSSPEQDQTENDSIVHEYIGQAERHRTRTTTDRAAVYSYVPEKSRYPENCGTDPEQNRYASSNVWIHLPSKNGLVNNR